MSLINATQLDFNEIRKGLVEYLKGRTEFKDANFSGSGLSYLIDLLSYNTQVLSWFLHMAVNESFIDSAQFRDTVVSLAKHLGYTPRSRRSAIAKIRLQLIPSGSPATITIPKWTKFTSKIDTETFHFHTTEEHIIPRSNTGTYVKDITIREGKILQKDWTYSTELKEKFVIPNPGVDTTTLEVRVQESSSNLLQRTYTLSEDINEVTANSLKYFLQEVENEKFEILFGDGFIGKALQNGNIVKVWYVLSSGAKANTCKSFTLADSISGVNTSGIVTIEAANGGSEIESLESIKKLAPLNYQAQNRAVTAQDYETLILKDIPQVESVKVWGGEDNDPPQYGFVFISLKPVEGTVFDVLQKKRFVDEIIKKRNLISVQVRLVDPEFLQVVTESVVKFSAVIGGTTGEELKNKVKASIMAYAKNNLNKFDSYFRYSKFIQAIDATDSSLINNLTSIKLKIGIYPTLFRFSKYFIDFRTELETGDVLNNRSTLSTSQFLYQGQTCQLSDDGKGSIYVYRTANNRNFVVQRNVGTINYKTGKIELINFAPEGILPLGKQTIDFIVSPKNFDVVPVRNQIIQINEEDITVKVIDENSGTVY